MLCQSPPTPMKSWRPRISLQAISLCVIGACLALNVWYASQGPQLSLGLMSLLIAPWLLAGILAMRATTSSMWRTSTVVSRFSGGRSRMRAQGDGESCARTCYP